MEMRSELMTSLHRTSRNTMILFVLTTLLSLYSLGLYLLFNRGHFPDLMKPLVEMFSRDLFDVLFAGFIALLSVLCTRGFQKQVEIVHALIREDGSKSFQSVSLRLYFPWLYARSARAGRVERLVFGAFTWAPIAFIAQYGLRLAYLFFELCFLDSDPVHLGFFLSVLCLLSCMVFYVLMIRKCPKTIQTCIRDLEEAANSERR